MKKSIIIGVIILAVIGFGIFLFSQESKYRPLDDNLPDDLPIQGQEYLIQGQQHIDVGATHESYNSNPPTSGPHYAAPADWGIYGTALPDEQLVHNLEHGGIWISYTNIDDIAKAKLVGLAQRYPGSVVLTPRPANDTKIAVASWGRLIKLADYEEEIILKFIKANKNKSPEPLAR